MRDRRATRSSKVKEEEDSKASTVSKASALLKVFYISEEALLNSDDCLNLEYFYHPGKGRPALFVTSPNNNVFLEVLEFAEPRRSWLINNRVSSNGRVYLTTPVDATFLALHYLRQSCSQKALALDSMDDGPTARRLLTTFVQPDALQSVADVKTLRGDEKTAFYKYSKEKTLAWLAIKTRGLAKELRSLGVHCGHSAVSQNYARSEKLDVEDVAQDIDFLRVACDVVGGYIDADLHEELKNYLEIPTKGQQSSMEEKLNTLTNNKRKSLKTSDENENKKARLSKDFEGSDVLAKLKNTSILGESSEEDRGSPWQTPLKERALSGKEKALAKSAKGTKSIASFFKK